MFTNILYVLLLTIWWSLSHSLNLWRLVCLSSSNPLCKMHVRKSKKKKRSQDLKKEGWKVLRRACSFVSSCEISRHDRHATITCKRSLKLCRRKLYSLQDCSGYKLSEQLKVWNVETKDGNSLKSVCGCFIDRFSWTGAKGANRFRQLPVSRFHYLYFGLSSGFILAKEKTKQKNNDRWF